MGKDSGTRSGLLWEVERLLGECRELPQMLLMENVPGVHGKKNVGHFAKWVEKLEALGYRNYWQDLNAKDYGIPQNRNRCFMVSLLGDMNYDFPEVIPLELRLKDMLEGEVDEKYYLSDNVIDFLNKQSFQQAEISKAVRSGGRTSLDRHMWDIITEKVTEVVQRPHGFNKGNRLKNCPSITSSAFQENNFLVEPKLIQVAQLEGTFESSDRVYGIDGLAPTVKTMQGGGIEPKIAEPFACDEQNRYMRNDGCVGTLTTDGSSPKHNNRVVEPTYRIRKLTPKECWRLMGFSDTDFDKASASGVSNSQLYKQAGNSIVVNVLMEILKQIPGVQSDEAD